MLETHGYPRGLQKAFNLHENVSFAQEEPTYPIEGLKCPDNDSQFQSPFWRKQHASHPTELLLHLELAIQSATQGLTISRLLRE